MSKIRCLIADDHVLFREGLRRILDMEDDMQCVALAADGEEAARLAAESKADVAIIDIAMPVVDGIEATKLIKASLPMTGVIMLSAYKYPHYVLASMRAGADGYLLKNTPSHELAEAVRMVHCGKAVFSMEVTKKVLPAVSQGNLHEHHIVSDVLHRREFEVLKLAAKGLSNKSIASTMGLTGHTVATHLVNIFRKMGVSSRTEAVLHALKEGWITVDDLSQ